MAPLKERGAYPLNLPALRGVEVIDLDPAMTIFVGETGRGTSTLIEGIAVAASFNAEVAPLDLRLCAGACGPPTASKESGAASDGLLSAGGELLQRGR
jgi:hypothetical protein